MFSVIVNPARVDQDGVGVEQLLADVDLVFESEKCVFNMF